MTEKKFAFYMGLNGSTDDETDANQIAFSIIQEVARIPYQRYSKTLDEAVKKEAERMIARPLAPGEDPNDYCQVLWPIPAVYEVEVTIRKKWGANERR